MAVALNKFNTFALDIGEKKHDLSVDTLKIMLTNTAPAAGNSVPADITEIAAGNGYTAGGLTVTQTSYATAGGVTKLVVANPSPWTATGGPMATFRYVVLYNSTAGRLIGYYDYGSAVTLAAGEQFQFNFDGTNGLLTIT